MANEHISSSILTYSGKDKGNIALIFQGQGTQYEGMGRDLYEADSTVKRLYKRAERILGYDLLNVTEEQLKKPDLLNLQF